jgi:SAM-dependent methyltransferase
VFGAPNSVRYEQRFEQTIRSHVPGKTALEIGCGEGLTARTVCDFGAAFVLGVDVSTNFIQKARRLEIPGRLEFQCADVLQAVDGTYDVIFGRSILHHIDFQAGLEKMYRHNLNPGGVMVFMEPLGSHPLLRFYHFVARAAHTADERPFDRQDLRWFTETFPRVRISPFGFFSFVAGLGSHLLFQTADNPLLRKADAADEWLVHRVPALGPYYRHCLVEIEKSY